MTFTNILPGSGLDPDVLMSNFRHINYGNALLPVNSSGVISDNTIALGSGSSRFAGTYTNGIASGAVGAPLWKWARIPLGPRNIIDYLTPGSNLMFTVSLSSIGPYFTGLMWSLTLIGDNGIVVGNCEKVTNFASRSGYMDEFYPAFNLLHITQTTVNIYQNFFFSGVYTSVYSWFHENLNNWRGTTANRGYLEVFYITP
jgi:hypothetical protein